MVSERTAAASPPPKPDPKEVELDAALAMARHAFAILGSRALVILAALASCGAWAYVLVSEPAYGVLSAALVTAMIFWPALWIDRRGGA